MDTPFQFAERYCMCVTPEASTASSSLALSLQPRGRTFWLVSSASLQHLLVSCSYERNQAFFPKDKNTPRKLSWRLCLCQSWRAKDDPGIGGCHGFSREDEKSTLWCKGLSREDTCAEAILEENQKRQGLFLPRAGFWEG